jgi:hypothetical protein
MIGSKKYQLTEDGMNYYENTIKEIDKSLYKYIPNPCGEATIHRKGAYCLLSDLAPYFADSFEQILHTGELAARFLIRTNLMNGIYSDEVERTNRIGISMTGIHEFAWKFFKYGFRDLINENKSKDFWNFVSDLRYTIEQAGRNYSKLIGVNEPHTFTVIKPAGSISKLFNLTEGAHLPQYDQYIRWTQFQNNDPLLQKYREEGYEVRELKTYNNVSIVGFPMQPFISTLGMGDKLVLSSEATVEEHYKWLQLLEKYWLGEGSNGQISYTLIINVDKISLDEFRVIVANNQSKIRCCAIMPQLSDEKLATLYEYLPNTRISKEKYEGMIENIRWNKMQMQFTDADLTCSSGACPL